MNQENYVAKVIPQGNESRDYYVVDAASLREIIDAIKGPPHRINELLVIASIPPELASHSCNPLGVIEKQIRMQEHLPTDAYVREMRVSAENPEYFKITTAFRTVNHCADSAGKALKELEPIYCKTGGWKLPENKE